MKDFAIKHYMVTFWAIFFSLMCVSDCFESYFENKYGIAKMIDGKALEIIYNVMDGNGIHTVQLELDIEEALENKGYTIRSHGIKIGSVPNENQHNH